MHKRRLSASGAALYNGRLCRALFLAPFFPEMTGRTRPEGTNKTVLSIPYIPCFRPSDHYGNDRPAGWKQAFLAGLKGQLFERSEFCPFRKEGLFPRPFPYRS
ncbi:hypothetical protein SRRS_19400 [Sporomusa rhizae]